MKASTCIRTDDFENGGSDEPIQRPDLTHLLGKWRHSARLRNREAADTLFPLIYADLLKIARRVNFSKSVDAADLVQELLFKWQSGALLSREWTHRGDFFALARVALKHILIDGQRRRRSAMKVPLENDVQVSADYMAIEAILDEIGSEVPQLEEVLALKLLTKLTDKEVAKVLEVSESTAKRHYKIAKAKFREKLKSRMIR